jgi:hypothetical protein
MKINRVLILIPIIVLTFGVGYGKEMKNIRRAVLDEVKKYPKLEIQDLYKLAYQAAMGNEHIMNDTAAAHKYLEEELASIDSSSSQPLMNYLTSDSSIARVNLRSFKAHKRNPAKLLEAMRKTASSFQPSQELLRSYLNDIETLAFDGKIPFKQNELNDYFQKMKQQNFPAVHHSKTVEENYRPAYRIISGREISFMK